ncbi:ImmA/IrrE family metallo-endopeptidase (plasmid) [Rhizobium ruizarguesonis]|uniref:UvrD-helicase domain-containing protein n=1 Tax=Rhizobium ruizarguesonis TaxID=2081791 RepID=UPI001031DEDD|nr:UvrD-helicase domain-containing protein [Rhizobium ruizarguesonis]TAW06321.1 ImmA/IrrE family metallo-endopeptidase [Rhizobium ruizarguesonis]
MENINSVRRAANELRRKIDPGLKQLAATEIIGLALDDQSLTVEKLGPSDTNLMGGIGVLKRRYLAIYVANDLDPSFEAEVIAHEIAHFVIHLEAEIKIERGYSAPGAGDPLQRVEAYSKKERREAQANAFAREFLLPRALARRLFHEGKRAREIATSLGIRLETVYQQLADSLLLPEATEKPPKTPRPPEPLDASQGEAAHHLGSPYLLEAGPGTGKTKTMVERIVWLLAQEHAKADDILALTFSNKAAEELAERVEHAVGASAVNIWSGTFHSFGLELLRKHHARFNLPPDPKLVDTSEAINLLEETLPALPIVHMQNLFDPALALRDILRSISRAKDELIGPEEYDVLAKNMMREADRADADTVKAAAKCCEVALVYKHYQAILDSMRAVDYGDLIRLPAVRLSTDEDFRRQLSDRYKWVHVDEYQDINRASAMLVKGIVGDGNRLWVVGDARQSIYRFRGASSRNMARFRRDYPSGELGQLKINYRSTDPILSQFKAFGNRMIVSSYSLPLDISAKRTAVGGTPEIFIGTDAQDEIDMLAGNIRELEKAGVSLRSQAIIARTNGILAEMAAELEARGVPVLYLGPLFERPEVRDMLSLLSLIVQDGSTLFRVGTFPEYGIAPLELSRVIEEAKSRQVSVKALFDQISTLACVTPDTIRRLALLASHLDGFGHGTTPWLALMEYLFDRSDYVRTVLAGQNPSDDLRRVAVRQLIEALRTMPLVGGKMPIVRGLERVRHLVLLSDDRELRRLPDEMHDVDGVQLMTIHASKGLEFEAVHLPRLKRGAVPAPNRADACPPPVGMVTENPEANAHDAEEECLFFVAMSRAKTHLKLYRPARSGGKTSNASIFVEGLSIQSGRQVAPVARLFPASTQEPIIDFGFPEGLNAADIESFDQCGRRFFYDKVAKLGGSADRSAYLQAHGCILAVVAAARTADIPLTIDAMRGVFETAWNSTKLVGHPFETQYRALVDRMMGNLLPVLASVSKATPFGLVLANREIAIAPHFVKGNAGSREFLTVRSGKRSATDQDKIAHTLLLEAARVNFGHGFSFETFHVMDGNAGQIEQTAAKRANRIATAQDAIRSIEEGLFPAKRSDFLCPRCRHFFICPAPQAIS